MANFLRIGNPKTDFEITEHKLRSMWKSFMFVTEIRSEAFMVAKVDKM
jgi:hypothetical protein